MADIGALTPNLIGAHVINVIDDYIALREKHDAGAAHNMNMTANIK